jgi:hypothetical protein
MAKANGQHDDGTEKVTAEEITKAIPANKAKALLAKARAARNDTATISDGLRAEIKTAREKYGLDTWAFGIIRHLDRLENETIAAKLDALNHLLDVCGINKRAESAPKFSDMTNVAELREAAE